MFGNVNLAKMLIHQGFLVYNPPTASLQTLQILQCLTRSRRQIISMVASTFSISIPAYLYVGRLGIMVMVPSNAP